MARILACGIATLDLVHVVEDYPVEDSEQRATQQFLWRGGNATNSLVVLSQLGHACHWLGTLAGDAAADAVRADLQQQHIDFSRCPVIDTATTPTSHILLASHKATRTIVHYRDLRELSHADMEGVTLDAFDWLHVEGRNVEVTRTFLQRLRQAGDRCPISLEVEKPRDDITSLFAYVDHILFGRRYAQSLGFTNAAALLASVSGRLQDTQLVCAWGEQGAYYLADGGECRQVPAPPVTQLVDTRAAGDVFNAGYIDACLRGLDSEASIAAACQLAADKCAQFGLQGLV